MKHLDEGQLRAYLDGSLDEKERLRVQNHLTECTRCCRLATAVEARGRRVGTLLSSMDPLPAREPVSAQVAWHRYKSYAERRKESNMLGKLFAPRHRVAWGAAGLVLVLAIALSFAPVRAFASNLLALFRVQKVEFIAVDPTQVQGKQALQDALLKLKAVMGDQVSFESEGEERAIDEATARSLSHFRVRLPAALSDEPHITLQPGVHAEMQIDLDRIGGLLTELGYAETDLPDSLDGAEIEMNLYPVVTAAYGGCGPDDEEWAQAQGPADFPEGCVVLVQTRSADLSAPPSLDVARLGSAYLQLLGLSADEAARFSQRVDWTTTFVVPVPEYMKLSYEDVTVDGVPGTLIRPSGPSRDEREYLLTWLKDGVAYGLLGAGPIERGLEIAGSLQ